MSTPCKSQLETEELIALLDSANRLNDAVGLRELLTSMLELAGTLLHSAAASVLLYDSRKQDLHFAAVTGPNSKELLNRRVPLQQSKAGQVYITGIALTENHLTDHYKPVDEQTKFTTRSMICIPLMHHDEKFGVMQILNKRDGTEPFTSRDMELVERLAAQASIALRNARLFEKLLASSGLYGEPEMRDDLLSRATTTGIPALKERITVLFADMRAFSRLCHVVTSPDRIQSMLSEFLTLMADQVISHHGIVNKFIGDGLLGLFRTADGATNAVRAAFAMTARFDELKASWDETSNVSLEFIDLGVGIATDEMILGTIGNDEIRDFTVVGAAVNLASALERSARGGRRILCNNVTYRATQSILGDSDGPLACDYAVEHKAIPFDYKMFHLKSLKSSTKPQLVFISFSTVDTQRVEDLLVKPLRQHGIEVFFSSDTISPAERWQQSVGEGLNRCDWFIAAVSTTSVASEWVRNEVMHAFTRPELKDRILPVLLDQAEPADLYWQLKQIQWVDLSTANPEAIDRIITHFQSGSIRMHKQAIV